MVLNQHYFSSSDLHDFESNVPFHPRRHLIKLMKLFTIEKYHSISVCSLGFTLTHCGKNNHFIEIPV